MYLLIKFVLFSPQCSECGFQRLVKCVQMGFPEVIQLQFARGILRFM